MGPIVDRTKENLVSTDNGIIMARHRLLKAARALAEKGVQPPGVDPVDAPGPLGLGDPRAGPGLQGRGARCAGRGAGQGARLGLKPERGSRHAERIGADEHGQGSRVPHRLSQFDAAGDQGDRPRRRRARRSSATPLASRTGQNATFFTRIDRRTGTRSARGARRSMQASTTSTGTRKDLVDEIGAANLVVMVSTGRRTPTRQR